jgi:hypothetical protein
MPRYHHADAKEERKYIALLILDVDTRWGEWLASRLGRALPPGKEPLVPPGQEAGWAPEPVWTQRLEENPLPLPGIFKNSVVPQREHNASPLEISTG